MEAVQGQESSLKVSVGEVVMVDTEASHNNFLVTIEMVRGRTMGLWYFQVGSIYCQILDLVSEKTREVA